MNLLVSLQLFSSLHFNYSKSVQVAVSQLDFMSHNEPPEEKFVNLKELPVV